MRFIIDEDRPVLLTDLGAAFTDQAEHYRVEPSRKRDEGIILHRGHPAGDVTLNHPGDGLFDEEIEELIEFVDDAEETPDKDYVLDTLRGARQIVAIQVLGGQAGIDALVPLWTWLSANRSGVLQADGQGYWDGEEFILEVG
jgi:hypothetical protein